MTAPFSFFTPRPAPGPYRQAPVLLPELSTTAPRPSDIERALVSGQLDPEARAQMAARVQAENAQAARNAPRSLLGGALQNITIPLSLLSIPTSPLGARSVLQVREATNRAVGADPNAPGADLMELLGGFTPVGPELLAARGVTGAVTAAPNRAGLLAKALGLPDPLAAVRPDVGPLKGMLERIAAPEVLPEAMNAVQRELSDAKGYATRVLSDPEASPELVQTAMARLEDAHLQHELAGGGFTYDPRTRQLVPKEGFAVANPPGAQSVDRPAGAAGAIREAMQRNAELLRQPDMMLGGWTDQKVGRDMIEVSQVRPDLEEAMALARQRGEKAVWDLARGVEIPVEYTKVAPNSAVQTVVSDYLRARPELAGARLPDVPRVDEARASQMAGVYARLKSDPANPEVQRAYRALVDETKAQYQALQDAGYRFEFVDEDPYKSSAEMTRDLRENRRLRVFKSKEGDHPLLSPEENTIFRAVHDAIGHGAGGSQFGPLGEELAYRKHAAMFSPLARRAMATETRGQNSWVNFGPHRALPPAQRPFAEQKAALWPEEFLGDYGDMPTRVQLLLDGGAGPDHAGAPSRGAAGAGAGVQAPLPVVAQRQGGAHPRGGRAQLEAPAAQPESWLDRLGRALYDPGRVGMGLGGAGPRGPAKPDLPSLDERTLAEHLSALPLSEAKALERFMGPDPVAPYPLFHGSHVPGIDQFKPTGELGVHLGTADQANERLRRLAGIPETVGPPSPDAGIDQWMDWIARGQPLPRPATRRGKPTIYPLWFNGQKHAVPEIPDLSDWGNLPTLLSELEANGIAHGEQLMPLLRKAARKAGLRTPRGADFAEVISDFVLAGAELPGRTEPVRKELRKLGVDGLRYENTAEGAGTSFVALDPAHQLKSVFNAGSYAPKSGSLMDRIRAAVDELGATLYDPGRMGMGLGGAGRRRAPMKLNSTRTLPLSDLLTSSRSMREAQADIAAGRGSRTKGPVHVWRTEDGRLLVTDGQHRLAEAAARGDRTISVKLTGEGYSDYWATPRKGEEWTPPAVAEPKTDRPFRAAGVVAVNKKGERRIFEGAIHPQAAYKAARAGFRVDPDAEALGHNGFVLQDGTYVSRADAPKHLKKGEVPKAERLKMGEEPADPLSDFQLDSIPSGGAQLTSWVPEPRGIFDRSAPKLQGTAPIPPEMRASMPRGRVSPLVDALVSSPKVYAGLRDDVEQGLEIGGAPWYELGPVKASFDAMLREGDPVSFLDFLNLTGAASIQNPTHNELASYSALLRALEDGSTFDAAKQAIRTANPSFAQPWGTEGMLANAAQARVRGSQLPASPGSANRKVAWYTHGKRGGSRLADVALDTHERRRFAQLAARSRSAYRQLKLAGAAGANDIIPIVNALDYTALSEPYRELAKEFDLPSAQAAQASRWLGGGKHTGLKSKATGDYVQILEDAVLATAKATGRPTDPEALQQLWWDIVQGRQAAAPRYHAVQ